MKWSEIEEVQKVRRRVLSLRNFSREMTGVKKILIFLSYLQLNADMQESDKSTYYLISITVLIEIFECIGFYVFSICCICSIYL